jgi:GNAT superfamily N-acetyltransferase
VTLFDHMPTGIRSSESNRNWPQRLAAEADVPALEALIPLSVHGLQASYYSQDQRDAAIGPVFGVDRQLIRDGTYFVAEQDGVIIGCGGWSRRRSLYGGDAGRATDDSLLDPKQDAARIRAFFIHPSWSRRGIGRSIMIACEEAIALAGERLYGSFDYTVVERYEIPMTASLSLSVVGMTKQLGAG